MGSSNKKPLAQAVPREASVQQSRIPRPPAAALAEPAAATAALPATAAAVPAPAHTRLPKAPERGTDYCSVGHQVATATAAAAATLVAASGAPSRPPPAVRAPASRLTVLHKAGGYGVTAGCAGESNNRPRSVQPGWGLVPIERYVSGSSSIDQRNLFTQLAAEGQQVESTLMLSKPPGMMTQECEEKRFSDGALPPCQQAVETQEERATCLFELSKDLSVPVSKF